MERQGGSGQGEGRLGESGVGKLTLLFFGSVLAVLLYSAYKIFPFFYYYLELQNQMEAAIRVAQTHTDDELRQKLLYHIKKMEIPMGAPENLLIERSADIMRVALAYEEVFYINWREKDYVIYTFPFLAQAEGKMGESTGKW